MKMSYAELVKDTIEKNFYSMTKLGPKNIGKFFSEENMEIWMKAFTHETYSKNNYDTLEFLGDRLLETIIPKMIYNKYYDLDEGQLTQIKINNVREEAFVLLVKKYGLDKLIRCKGIEKKQIPILYGDIFESFIGALYDVSNTIGLGVGYIVCENVVINLFNDMINLDMIYGPEINIAQQMIAKFKGDDNLVKAAKDYFELVTIKQKGALNTYKLKLKKVLIDDMIEYTGINLYENDFVKKDGTISSVSINNEKDAEKILYAKVIKKFESIGFTRESMYKYKFDKDMNKASEYYISLNKNGEEIINSIKERMNNDGFIRLETKKPGKGKQKKETINIVMLYGIYYTDKDNIIEKKVPLLVYDMTKKSNIKKVEYFLYEMYSLGFRISDTLPELD
jgi:hypothetical protein